MPAWPWKQQQPGGVAPAAAARSATGLLPGDPRPRFLGMPLPRDRRVHRLLGGGIAALVIANEVRGVLMVAAIGGELWRSLIGAG